MHEQLDEIFPRLPEIDGTRIGQSQGNVLPDQFLTDFLARYREAWAYYEYETALLEPGLSPEQRRLLLGGAIRRLQLPLPPAELQPTTAPQTLIPR